MPPARPETDKWALFRALSKAQAAFGVTSRELTVLQALLSFHPGATLGGARPMIVFPSNRAICERLNGMACSTMRRHLARLIDAGLVARRDSPNGKRYRRRDDPDRSAFGFDLSPLLRLSGQIHQAAEAAREAELRHRAARETVSLMRRDLAGLVALCREELPEPGNWDRFDDLAVLSARSLRRKLSIDDLTELGAVLQAALDELQQALAPLHSAEPSTCDARNEQHQQKTDKRNLDSVESATISDERTGASEPAGEDRVSLSQVIACCPSLGTFWDRPIHQWHDLCDAAGHLRSAMGIDGPSWNDARARMGPECASLAVAAMLERFGEIRAPGAYLRALSKRASEGKFSASGIIAAAARRQVAAGPCA